MKHILFLLLSFLIIACNTSKRNVQDSNKNIVTVLNFGTAHLSNTTDANSAIRDLKDSKVKSDINKIVAALVKFKPTIICIEMPPDNNSFVNEVYKKYIIDQSNRLNYSDELNSIGFETGRLSGVNYIYGIDNQLGFDYPSLIEIANNNKPDSLFVENMMDSYKRVNDLPILEQFYEINTKSYKMETFNFYNFLATKHTKSNFEGADVISEFYKRNLRMYSNFCDIPFTKEDRVLIILGATHTAYFDVFLENDSRFRTEEVLKYLDFN